MKRISDAQLKMIARELKELFVSPMIAAQSQAVENHRNAQIFGSNETFGSNCWYFVRNIIRAILDPTEVNLDALPDSCEKEWWEGSTSEYRLLSGNSGGFSRKVSTHEEVHIYFSRVGETESDTTRGEAIWEMYPRGGRKAAEVVHKFEEKQRREAEQADRESREGVRKPVDAEQAELEIDTEAATLVLAWTASPESGLFSLYLAEVGEVNERGDQITDWSRAALLYLEGQYIEDVILLEKPVKAEEEDSELSSELTPATDNPDLGMGAMFAPATSNEHMPFEKPGKSEKDDDAKEG